MRGIALGAALIVALAATAVAEDKPGDPENGKSIFGKCRACHQIGENAKIMVGPPLNGIIGRPAGSWPGFNYSEANKTSGITWDEATFREYIHNPKAKIPGTKMVFVGIQDDQDVDDLIAYLKQYDHDGKKAQ